MNSSEKHQTEIDSFCKISCLWNLKKGDFYFNKHCYCWESHLKQPATELPHTLQTVCKMGDVNTGQSDGETGMLQRAD